MGPERALLRSGQGGDAVSWLRAGYAAQIPGLHQRHLGGRAGFQAGRERQDDPRHDGDPVVIDRKPQVAIWSSGISFSNNSTRPTPTTGA